MLNFILYSPALGFYFAGVQPTNYNLNEPVPLLVNSLKSVKKAVPFDYYTQKFHFCTPETIVSPAESLGSVLFGDRLFNSPFELLMKKDVKCKKLCEAFIPGEHVEFINDAIKEEYINRWMVDGLPIAQIKNDKGGSYPGIMLGQVVGEKPFLNNHFEIFIYVHQVGDQYRVVGAFVKPLSRRSLVCEDKHAEALSLDGTENFYVSYTYDVTWLDSTIPWGSRWDNYLSSSDTKVHWFR
jgi:transmembrane 9 superfamily protein 2/4